MSLMQVNAAMVRVRAARLVAFVAVACVICSQIACRPRIEPVSAAMEDGLSPVQRVDVNRNFVSGNRFEISVDPEREIDQVTVSWDTRYSLLMRDARGNVVLNDEGKPKYRDGLYAYAKIVDDRGSHRDIAAKKFVAPGETDNWHDLHQVRGSRLVIEFWHSRESADDPDVVAARRSVLLRSIEIRYKDALGQVFQDFVFNPDYDDPMSPRAWRVANGGRFQLNIPGHLRVYRLDVRWGDAKPRVNGVYMPGTATGRLKFNGVWQGGPRNVAQIETQTWADLSFPPPAEGHHTLVVTIENDEARIHSVRVYHQP